MVAKYFDGSLVNLVSLSAACFVGAHFRLEPVATIVMVVKRQR